jgi:hypothetical protein
MIEAMRRGGAESTHRPGSHLRADRATCSSDGGVRCALRLDLPCGNFYFTSIQSSLALTIHVHGRAALYVAGDGQASSPLAFVLDGPWNCGLHLNKRSVRALLEDRKWAASPKS